FLLHIPPRHIEQRFIAGLIAHRQETRRLGHGKAMVVLIQNHQTAGPFWRRIRLNPVHPRWSAWHSFGFSSVVSSAAMPAAAVIRFTRIVAYDPRGRSNRSESL